MAQKSQIEELDSILLYTLKEVIRSECNISDDQNKMSKPSADEKMVPVFEYTKILEKLTLLEQKVEAIYSLIANMQKLANSAIGLDESEDYRIIQTENPSEVAFDYPDADKFESNSSTKKEYIKRKDNIRSKFSKEYLKIVKNTKVCIFRKNKSRALSHTKQGYLPFFASGSIVRNLSADDETSLTSIKHYLKDDEFSYVIINRSEITDDLLKDIRKIRVEEGYLKLLIVKNNKPIYSIFNNIISSKMETDRNQKKKKINWAYAQFLFMLF